MEQSLLPDSDIFAVPNIYKNRLQQHAHRADLGFPVYTTVGEGPPHLRRFKSTVSVGGKSYESLEISLTRKEAEQSAAKAACDALILDATQDVNKPKDEGLYKNLLQEFAQKRNIRWPTYETARSGLCHDPIFVSTVAVGKDTYRGIEAKSKKQAEMHAAKLAYCTLTNGCLATKSSEVLCKDASPVTPLVGNISQNIQTTETTKEHPDTSYEGCLTTKSTEVLCTYESPVVDNLSQNIQPISTTKKLQDEGCLVTNSSEVLHMDESPVTHLLENTSQNIQLTATSKKHQRTSYEDPNPQAKRAKPSTEITYAITPSPCYLLSLVSNVVPPQVGNSCPAPPDQAARKEPLQQSAVLEGATVND